MKFSMFIPVLVISCSALHAGADLDQLRSMCPVDDRITCNEIVEKIVDLRESVSVCCSELDNCIDITNMFLVNSPCNVEIPITQADMPLTITTPGRYCVLENLSGTLTIDADDVLVDFNGFKISSASPNNIFSNTHQNITIVNGIVGDSTLNGIFLVSCTSVIIADIKFEESDTGCELRQVQGFRVHNCSFENHDSNTAGALYLNASVDGKVSKCSFYDNARAQACLAVVNSSNIVLFDVSAENSTGNNIFNLLTSNNCNLIGCLARGTSSAAAFSFNNTPNCSCFGCEASDISGDGFIVTGANTDSLILDHCVTLSAQNDVGFNIQGSATSVCVLNCLAADTSIGFRLATSGNYIFNNLAKNNNTNGFFQTVVSNVWLGNIAEYNATNFGVNIPTGNISLFVTTGGNAGKFRDSSNTIDVTPSDWDNISVI